MTIALDVSDRETISLDEALTMVRDQLSVPQPGLDLICQNSDTLASLSAGLVTHLAISMSLQNGEWDQELVDRFFQSISLSTRERLGGAILCTAPEQTH